MLNYSDIVSSLQNLTHREIRQADLAKATGITRATMSYREKNNCIFSVREIMKLEKYFNVNLLSDPISTAQVTYRPDVYLSAGYGVEVYEEAPQQVVIDELLLRTDRGTKINPKNCEIVTISGNSMAPEYRHGDRVILDKSITHFIDGHIFAFKYKNECFVKEICIMGDKIKCIPLNKEYEAFVITFDDEVEILGRILPRIRF